MKNVITRWPVLRRALVATATTAAAVLLILAVWQVAITVTDVSPYLTKSPLDVVRYLAVDGAADPGPASQRRALLAPMIATTVVHASAGLVLGVSLGIVGAVAMSASRALRAAFLPLALVLQTVPLIAMAPVIYAVFGSGVLTAAVIAAVVTFFPLLMNVTTGLASASRQCIDLVHVYGGGRWTTLWKVQIPSALPHVFAGLRIAAPATVSAATLYEFLFSFSGLGANLLTSRSYSDYGLLWTLVVVTVVLALGAYAAVTVLERAVLAGRYPPAPTLTSRGG